MNKPDLSHARDSNLISRMSHHCQVLSGEVDHAFHTIGIRSSHGVFAAESFQSDGGSEMCSTQSLGLQLSGSVFNARRCANDGTRFVARYQDQFTSATQTFLTYGVTLQNDLSQHVGQYKSRQTLGSFCQLGSSFDKNGAYALRRQTNQHRTERADGRDRLCTGFDDDRLVPESVQLGTISNSQGCRQASHVDRFEGFDSKFYLHQRRQDAQRQSSRLALRARLYRGWRVLRHGQGLRRLWSTLQLAHRQGFLCDQGQSQHLNRIDPSLSHRQQHWIGQRASCPVDPRIVDYWVPRSTQMRHVHRNTDRQEIRVSHQRLCFAGRYDLRSIQATMASRIVLQVNQTASLNQSIYGNTENAVKTHVWVAIAIMKKRLNLKHSLYEILRVLDLNMFETTPIETLLGRPSESNPKSNLPIQQNLFQTLGQW